jgi:Kef-type K+ transport system membrane component KefB
MQRGQLRATVTIAQSSIAAPFILGAALATVLYQRLAPAGVRFTHFALFLGIAMSITAFPVLARILADWLTCAAIITVATIGKFGGTFADARLAGHSGRKAASLGVLMNTRGLMELVVLNVGLDLGVSNTGAVHDDGGDGHRHRRWRPRQSCGWSGRCGWCNLAAPCVWIPPRRPDAC